MTIDVAKLRALLANAAPGEWQADLVCSSIGQGVNHYTSDVRSGKYSISPCVGRVTMITDVDDGTARKAARGHIVDESGLPETTHDAAFIVAAHNAFAELLDAYEERERLREILERLRTRMAEPQQPIIQWDAGTWIAYIDAALEGRE